MQVHHGTICAQLTSNPARRDRFLLRRTFTSLEHTSILRKRRLAAKCQSHICRDNRARLEDLHACLFQFSRRIIDVREVDSDTLQPILSLLQNPDLEVQRAASAALGNLAVNSMFFLTFKKIPAHHSEAENKVLIVQLGGLQPLIRQMMSTNVEVQCNAVGCITNLATHEDNKAKIARSGALGPLTRLAKSKDMRVQRNATGALLNMTHSGKADMIPQRQD